MACAVEDPRMTQCRLWHGANIGGMVIMHTCDTPACYRYDHLRLGTQLDNIADMTQKGRAVGGGGQLKGGAMPNALLTDEQAQQLRSDYQSGISGIKLARIYGIHKSIVYRIINRQAYT